MKKMFLIFAVVIILATAATMTMAATLAEWDFDLDSYTTLPGSPGYYRYTPVGGSLGTAYTDVRIAPDNTATNNTSVNWEQFPGVSGAADDKNVHWWGRAASHSVNTGTGTSADSKWLTSTNQTLTVSAYVNFDKVRYAIDGANYLNDTKTNNLNQMFTFAIGQSTNTSSSYNLFNVNAAIFSPKFLAGGTNPGGSGSTNDGSTYTVYNTPGNNAAVASNNGTTGTQHTVATNKGYAGLTIGRNDSSYTPVMTKFAEKGEASTIEITDDFSGPGNEWYLYTITMDFSARNTATYNVYLNNTLQATLTQNLPTATLPDANAYWTVREFRIGSNGYFRGAIDNLKVSNTIDNPAVPEPATFVGLLAFAPALIAAARRRK